MAEALRKIRSWLQPYVMLLRYWRAYTELPPPKETRRCSVDYFQQKALSICPLTTNYRNKTSRG